jgi:glutamate synthase (NADPH/NADH) large chain
MRSALSSCRRTRLRDHFKKIIADVVAAEGQVLIGFRDVPVDNSSLSKAPEIAATEPVHIQVFIGRGEDVEGQRDFERRLFMLRKVISNRVSCTRPKAATTDFYFRFAVDATIVYKGMFLAYQVGAYYKDLTTSVSNLGCCAGAPAVLDQHVPVLEAAHPYRMVAHNGEINTLRGNVNWMAARQASVSRRTVRRRHLQAVADLLRRAVRHGLLRQCARIPDPGGYSMAHAVMMLIPEAWAGNKLMDEERKAFYEYHAALMEPWDGPAAVAFTDGRQIGATLDRNGLRPGALHRHRRRPRDHGLRGRGAAGG